MPAQKNRAFEPQDEDDDPQDHSRRQNGHDDTHRSDAESDRSRSPESSEDDKDEKDEYVAVRLSEIRKEVQCPICLGIIRKTRTVMECLHRFCRECIDKSMRLGNNECPACRTHCASRRSLRDDPNYDALISVIYPDIDKYEEEELAFHEEEKARNKQIQASIAQTFRRQTEALGGRKRTSAKATAAAFMRRTHGNSRRRRNSRNALEIQGSDDNEEANGNDGGKDSSSADERTEPRSKRPKRWAGGRDYQPSSAAVNADGDDGNDYEVNKEVTSASMGLVRGRERLSWGNSGMRSHTRYGSSSGGNGKNARNSRVSKLVDYLRNSKANDNEVLTEVHFGLVSFDEQSIASLQRPYLCCNPTVSVGQLCQYVAAHTALQANEVEIYLLTKPQDKVINQSVDPTNVSIATSGVSDSSKDAVLLLREEETLAEVRARHPNTGNLLLSYQKKWNVTCG